MSGQPHRPPSGFTLVDTLMGSVIATLLLAVFFTVQVSVTRGVGAINQHATYQTTLIQATNRMQQDVLTATQALASWNGLTTQQNSSLTAGAVARWILEVPVWDANGTSAPLGYVVYKYLGASKNPPQNQLSRIYYAPGVTPPANPTTNEVIANGVEAVGFLNCSETWGADIYTHCVEIYLRTRLANPALASGTILPTRRVRVAYRNSP